MKLFPFTYINANLSSDHGITAAKLVELVSIFAHAQGVTRVDLSGNLVSGSKYKYVSQSVSLLFLSRLPCVMRTPLALNSARIYDGRQMNMWQKEKLVTNMDKLKQTQGRGRPCAAHMRGRQDVERSGRHG